MQTNASLPQPAPQTGGRVVLEAVMADLQERAETGKAKYGTYLTTNNGRNPLWDAYQEALDLAMYLRQALLEQEGGAKFDITDGRELTDELIDGDTALDVLGYIEAMIEQGHVIAVVTSENGHRMVVPAHELPLEVPYSVLGHGDCAADALCDAMNHRHEWLSAHERGERYVAPW